jgi:hypothetical protein
VPDPVVIEKVVEVLVFGCAYEKIADGSCSATTLRRRGTEWICLGVMEALRQTAPEAYERIVGLEFSDVAVDCAASLRPVEKPSSSTRSCATPLRPWTWTSPTSARRASTPRT